MLLFINHSGRKRPWNTSLDAWFQLKPLDHRWLPYRNLSKRDNVKETTPPLQNWEWQPKVNHTGLGWSICHVHSLVHDSGMIPTTGIAAAPHNAYSACLSSATLILNVASLSSFCSSSARQQSLRESVAYMNQLSLTSRIVLLKRKIAHTLVPLSVLVLSKMLTLSWKEAKGTLHECTATNCSLHTTLVALGFALKRLASLTPVGARDRD